MRSQNVTKMLVLLLAICCLVPLAALAAVLYLAAPMWLVALVGLLAVALLARRLMALLATNDEPGFSHELSTKRRLSTHDHRQH